MTLSVQDRKLFQIIVLNFQTWFLIILSFYHLQSFLLADVARQKKNCFKSTKINYCQNQKLDSFMMIIIFFCIKMQAIQNEFIVKVFNLIFLRNMMQHEIKWLTMRDGKKFNILICLFRTRYEISHLLCDILSKQNKMFSNIS